MGHARALLALDSRQQRRIASVIVEKRLSVRQTEQLVAKLGDTAPVKTAPPALDTQTRWLQQQLAAEAGMRVAFRNRPDGSRVLGIGFSDLEQLQTALQRIEALIGASSRDRGAAGSRQRKRLVGRPAWRRYTSAMSCLFSRADVFAAWLSNDSVVAPVTNIDIEPHVGGRYRLHVGNGADAPTMRGRVVAIEQDRHVRHTWCWDGAHESLVDVRFDDSRDSTVVLLQHSGLADDDDRRAPQRRLGQLH